MAKYLVETYYTCSFKVSHYLDEINEADIQSLEKREDGKFEILDLKLDNRKTKNLDKIENSLNYAQQESLDELEENFGKLYLDEDLNDKDNPFGLTEFDIEEIDELLNLDKVESGNQ